MLCPFSSIFVTCRREQFSNGSKRESRLDLHYNAIIFLSMGEILAERISGACFLKSGTNLHARALPQCSMDLYVVCRQMRNRPGWSVTSQIYKDFLERTLNTVSGNYPARFSSNSRSSGTPSRTKMQQNLASSHARPYFHLQ